MTHDKDLKKLVRARARRTGESYAAARRSLLGGSGAGGSAQAPVAPEDTIELWFSRASQGYTGKGAKPRGIEHHTVVRTPQGLVVESDVAFSNYGLQCYSVRSDAVGGTARFDYAGDAGRIVVESVTEGGAWRSVVDVGGERYEVAFDDLPAPAVPSVASRFLPMLDGFADGDGFEFVPVPEDAYPAWYPRGKSWFPLMGAARESLVHVRRIVRRAPQRMEKVKGSPTWVGHDHVDLDGTVRATTWLTEEGAVVAYEQPGCVLRSIAADEARALDPRPD